MLDLGKGSGPLNHAWNLFKECNKSGGTVFKVFCKRHQSLQTDRKRTAGKRLSFIIKFERYFKYKKGYWFYFPVIIFLPPRHKKASIFLPFWRGR